MVETRYSRAITSLWHGVCTVTVQEHITDERTGRAVACETVLYANLPCRLSFGATVPTERRDSAAVTAQSTTLFIDRTVTIPAGSKITVTQNGVTERYKQSGVPAVYSVHQEIPLEQFGRWA